MQHMRTWRQTKRGRRLELIGINSANSLVLPIFNTAVSLLVVRLASPALWGEFVTVMLVVQLGTHLIAWGNREYLLRAFSREPNRLAALWQSSLVTRSLLFVLLILLIAAFNWPLARAVLVMIWAAAFVIYQAHEVVIVYRRAFAFSLGVETATFTALLIAIVLSRAALSLDRLIAFFAATIVAKAALLLWHFRSTTLIDPALASRINVRYFRLALPFMLVGLTGLINSRIDLYSVSLMLPPADVGRYEIFSGLLLYFQAGANFILLPFVKSLYHLEYAAIRRIARRLFMAGVALVGPFLIAVALLLRVLYHIDMPLLFYVFGGLYVLPMYYYLPLIYALYKADQQSTVLAVSSLGIVLKLAANLLLLPRFGLPGAIVSVAVIQWLILVIYVWRAHRLRRVIALRPVVEAV